MTVKDLIELLEDKETPLYLACSDVNDTDSIRLNPRCDLLCKAFNDYLIESILPIAKDGDEGNDYGGGLMVYLKTEIKLLKKSD